MVLVVKICEGKARLGSSEEGIERTLTAQVCDVNKALLSVRKVVAAGNKVIFDSDGSYIEDKTTGERMLLKDKEGMYMLSVWVKAYVF